MSSANFILFQKKIVVTRSYQNQKNVTCLGYDNGIADWFCVALLPGILFIVNPTVLAFTSLVL